MERFSGLNDFDEYCHSYKIIPREKWIEKVDMDDENVIEKKFEELELFPGNAIDYIMGNNKEEEKWISLKIFTKWVSRIFIFQLGTPG